MEENNHMNSNIFNNINVHIDESIYTLLNDASLNSIEELFDSLDQYLNESIKEFKQKRIKKRKKCEHNCTEYIFGRLLIDRTISKYEDLLKPEEVNEKLIFNIPEDKEKYIEDMSTRKINDINNYINNFHIQIALLPQFSTENIAFVYITGKTCKNQKINDLNKGIDNKKAKADLYIELNNSSIIGFSIKQNKKATKSNFSVQKMLSKENNQQLTLLRKKTIDESGISHTDKTKRDEINKLFYKTNELPYWTELKSQINLCKSEIKKQLILYLFPIELPYDIYEFDGEKINKLNETIDVNEVLFEEHLPYYYDKSGKLRETAKLFYQLIIHEKIYRVEVRWKGNIYNASPQFQIHDDNAI
jgi:hypothetical protein